MKIEKVKLGWKKLESILNTIISAVNQNDPQSGDGCAVDHTSTGAIIRIVKQNSSNPTQLPNPNGGGGGIWHDVAWQQVTLVDPNTCSQTQAYVLIQKPGSSVTIS